MLQITRQTEYAIRGLQELARRQADAPVQLKIIAGSCEVSEAFLAKIFQMLAQAGIVKSHRGVKGGYTLARDPETISVTEVIGALEGPIGITECIDDTPGECSHEARCPVRGNWHRINEGIRQALDGINLAEMAQPPAPPLVSLGGASAAQNADLG